MVFSVFGLRVWGSEVRDSCFLGAMNLGFEVHSEEGLGFIGFTGLIGFIQFFWVFFRVYKV